MVDSVVKVKKEYYLQTLLEECKYEAKKAKMENLINGESESSSSENETERDNESDNKPSNKTDNESDNE